MAAREFEFTKTKVLGKAASALRIQCSSCDRSELFLQTSDRRLPHEAAAQKFRNFGWIVGSTPRKDLCPDCQRKERTVKPTANANTPPTPKADPPRELGREDRRIIFSEIDAHYAGADVGYADGWTDDRVAASLGVPRAWVTAVRDQFFGPAVAKQVVAADTAKRLDAIEMRIADIDITELEKRQASLAAEVTAAIARLGSIRDEIANIREQITAIGGGDGG